MQDLGSRIAQLRREKKLSQEALAEKTGVSRQAVSKWERGESAPDTENLITLSEVFGVTLDELLNKEKALEPQKTEEAVLTENTPANENEVFEASTEKGGKKAKKEKPKKVKRVKKERLFPKAHSVFLKIPVIIIVPLVFVLFGILKGAWSTVWLINLLIPIYYGFVHAFGARTKKSFLLRLPVFFITAAVFISVGVLCGKWHPAWMVFFIDLIYYWVPLAVKKDK